MVENQMSSSTVKNLPEPEIYLHAWKKDGSNLEDTGKEIRK